MGSRSCSAEGPALLGGPFLDRLGPFAPPPPWGLRGRSIKRPCLIERPWGLSGGGLALPFGSLGVPFWTVWGHLGPPLGLRGRSIKRPCLIERPWGPFGGAWRSLFAPSASLWGPFGLQEPPQVAIGALWRGTSRRWSALRTRPRFVLLSLRLCSTAPGITSAASSSGSYVRPPWRYC